MQLLMHYRYFVVWAFIPWAQVLDLNSNSYSRYLISMKLNRYLSSIWNIWYYRFSTSPIEFWEKTIPEQINWDLQNGLCVLSTHIKESISIHLPDSAINLKKLETFSEFQTIWKEKFKNIQVKFMIRSKIWSNLKDWHFWHSVNKLKSIQSWHGLVILLKN